MLLSDEIRSISIDKLVPNSINPNKMPAAIYARMKASIKKFGVINAILVREKGEGMYEIVDGEWRWRVSKELNLPSIKAKVMDISDDEVKQFIFATTIKGKMDPYETVELIQDISDEGGSELLKACNIDDSKLHRTLGYSKVKGAKVVLRNADRNKIIKKEEDSPSVEKLEEFKSFLVIPFSPKDYVEVTKKLEVINKDFSKALIQLCGVTTDAI